MLGEVIQADVESQAFHRPQTTQWLGIVSPRKTKPCRTTVLDTDLIKLPASTPATHRAPQNMGAFKLTTSKVIYVS